MALQFYRVEEASPASHASVMAKSKAAGRRPIYVREHRKVLGLSQEELADKAKMSTGNLSEIERGNTDYTGASLARLAAALDVDVLDLFRKPTEGAELFSLYDRASPQQRKRMERLAEALLKEPD